MDTVNDRGLSVVAPTAGPTPAQRWAELQNELRVARDELLQTERRLKVVDDASAPMFRALASAVSCMHNIGERMDAATAHLDANTAKPAVDQASDKVLRKALSELPRAIDRMVSDRHRRAVWVRLLYDIGKIGAGFVVGYVACFWGLI